MGVNLTKGQKISLTKQKDGIKGFVVGLGWDVAKQKGFFKKVVNHDIDCDASAFLIDGNGKLIETVYYGHKKDNMESVLHGGDNLTGAGDGDDETINILLDKVSDDVEKIVVGVNIYSCVSRGQHFGMIDNAYIRVMNRDTGEELVKFNLSEDYKGKTALFAGEIFRQDGEWKFNALGEATNDTSVSDMERRY